MNDFLVYSISKRPDNMHLWWDYGGQHRGYCLEFANQGMFARAKDVSYLDPAEMGIVITDPRMRSADFFYCKTPRWAPEEEVRIVNPRFTPHEVRFQPDLLTQIILGKDMSSAHRELITGWARERQPELRVANAHLNFWETKVKIGD